jgi:hypothetical protein
MNQALKFGALTGIVSSLYTLVLYYTGQAGNTILGLGGFVILIAGIVLAHLAFRTAGDGTMGYGKGVLVGTVTSLVAGVVSGIYSYFHFKHIAPELVEQKYAEAITGQEAALAQQGMSPEEAAAAMEMSEKFMDVTISPGGFAIMAVVGTLILGVIFSLIVAIFTQKSGSEAA